MSTATAVAGIERAYRPFHPHVTVVRLPRPRSVEVLLAGLGDAPIGQAWTVDHVVLFESDTRPDGAVHTEIARFPLSGKGLLG